ncbi:MAG: hypothetical protein BZY79_06480 [SAR202 cluster bacterium Casp-Chloro-G4]|nr:hypothetical protein [Chloroflexota bacterium]MDA1227687.1 hypothetical protein [Chloroflexota bacterium]PKB60913.1 MAG: hypothetical protein BZY79_06480 [SAR202 cluster bacterium Casp-Chloro-G4]
MMDQTLRLEVDVKFFQLEESAEAESLAKQIDGAVYTWKTIRTVNWLEHGFRNVDALGLVVLPRLLPDEIQMSDDPEE